MKIITTPMKICLSLFLWFNEFRPANIYLYKTNNRKTAKKGVFIVNFKHISHLFLVFLLLTLNK